MTAGKLAWWHAMVGAAQFEDGSLVFQDSTLSVNGGSAVNLLVKLGAKPRSDVTVVLSETNALISLGSASLTFTPDNWDTYQSVVVTAGGNSQSIALNASWYEVSSVGGGTNNWRRWTPPTGGRPQFDASLSSGGADRFLGQIGRRTDIAVNFLLDVEDTQAGTGGRADLTSAFETSGQIQLTAGGMTALAAPDDTSDPYSSWDDLAEIVTLFDALQTTSGTEAGTLIVRDFESFTATISLSASGPDEYASVSGSATVTVT